MRNSHKDNGCMFLTADLHSILASRLNSKRYQVFCSNILSKMSRSTEKYISRSLLGMEQLLEQNLSPTIFLKNLLNFSSNQAEANILKYSLIEYDNP